MKIEVKAFGGYETNCYILSVDGGEFVIDPGVGATEWVVKKCKNPIAILNTHGHFDHVWSNAELKEIFKDVPIICPKEDSFMLKKDTFGMGMDGSVPDIEVECKKGVSKVLIAKEEIKFHHFPGHTPGCSMIEIGDYIFSGDFIFEGSIGRSDFPYSDRDEMIKSLVRFLKFDSDKTLYPGHGNSTNIKAEQSNISHLLSGKI